jgi:hypothetical protein
MLQNDSTTANAVASLARIFGYFGRSQQANQSDSDAYRDSKWESIDERPECGGFNEAFVIQHWASYSPRH